MAWIYLLESAGSVSLSETGSHQSPTAKSNHIVKASCCKECRKDICPKHQYGIDCNMGFLYALKRDERPVKKKLFAVQERNDSTQMEKWTVRFNF